jgi:ABC-type phosphate transport system substrate-binding protein
MVRLAGLSAVAGSAAIIAATPGANASYFDTAYNSVCKGAADFHGLGASTQRSALLDGWGATLGAPSPGGPNATGFGYDAGADYSLCGEFKLPGDGGTKTFSYRATGSGSCIDALGGKNANDPRTWVDATDPNNPVTVSDLAYCGTDDAPTQQQIDWAEQGPPVHPAEAQFLTIPVAQVAIAPVVRLPDGCQVGDQSKRSISRTVLSNAFEGNLSKWSDIFGTAITAASGSGLSDADCQNAAFVRVVRLDSSGSTFLFKRYLNQASHATGGDSFDWRDPADGGTLANTDWPNVGTIVRGDASGAGSVLDKLSAQNATGGIAYADLATARAKTYGWTYSGTYAPDDTKLWLRAQRIGNDSYVSPAVTNAQAATGANAGAACQNVTYKNAPTTDLSASWQPVDATETATDFPICGLTYQVASVWNFDTKNARYKPVWAGETQGENRAYRDFLRYELGIIRPGVGPSKLAPLGYAKLPADILVTAQNAAKQIGWLRASTDPAPADPVS